MDSPKVQDDLPQNKTGPSSPGSPVSVEELQYHFEGLRSLFIFALIGLILMTLTIDLCFIRRQMTYARQQLDDQRPKVSEKVAGYKKRTEPLVKNFTASMQNFASSNQDFRPILEKYRPFLLQYMQPAASAPATSGPAKTPGK